MSRFLVFSVLLATLASADSSLYKGPLFKEGEAIPKDMYVFGCLTTKGYKVFRWKIPPKLEQVLSFEAGVRPVMERQDDKSIQKCKEVISELKEGIRNKTSWSEYEWYVKVEAPHARCCF